MSSKKKHIIKEELTNKTVISSSKAAKKLGVQKGAIIEPRGLQTFIAKIFKDDKEANSV